MKQLGIIKVVETRVTVYQVETDHPATGEELKAAAKMIHTGGIPTGYKVTPVTESASDTKYHLDYQLTQDRPKEQNNNEHRPPYRR